MPPKPTPARGGLPKKPLSQAAEAAAGQGHGFVQDQQAPSAAGSDAGGPVKKKRHRAGRKRKNRRQSFAAPSETGSQATGILSERRNLDPVSENRSQSSFYRLHNRAAESNESLDSQALLDHRYALRFVADGSDQNRNPLRHRRQSIQQGQNRPSQMQYLSTSQHHSGARSPGGYSPRPPPLDESDDETQNDDRAPLIGSRSSHGQSYGGFGPSRRSTSSTSLRKRQRQVSIHSQREDYDVNNPPSRPGTPRFGSVDDAFDDIALPEYGRSPDHRRAVNTARNGEAVIDIEVDDYTPSSPNLAGHRRRGDSSPMEDVCLPFERVMTEVGDDDDYIRQNAEHERAHRRHRKAWPDLSVLEEWSHEEKEERTMEGIRAKKVDEPVLIGGRLRPQRGTWRREVEEAPFRWTYFNDEFDSSLRSHTISGLQQLGHSFRELFIPEPPEIEDSSSDEDDDVSVVPERSMTPINGGHTSRAGLRQPSIVDNGESKRSSGEHTPQKPQPGSRPKRYGPRPVFWLDVLQPTWEEMRVLSRAFGIHKLTAEDIMEQEAREKVELFRNYYFVNYRTFEQDEKSEDYMDPVNMYFVVFKGGVISMPHPPNVRRRIRQLAEHQYTDSDWIAYAIIDNITDAYAPLIEQIEQEVDDIDDEILMLHSKHQEDKQAAKGKTTADEPQSPSDSRVDMLLRVGECRKRVMGLYRLLGNKADVIKGLAKRCNEQWQVAPRSDVGLYLGDIQDHIVTMTGNLTHYESILSRAHSNYLAQINIGMNERAEKTNDVLGKLTVLGTIVLPMNIVTGMWGMNCLVPGQVEDNPTLWWFFGLTTFLLLFGLSSFFVAKKVYKIV